MQAIGTDPDAAARQGLAIVHDIERAADLSSQDLDDLDAQCGQLQGEQQKLCIGKALMQYREKLKDALSPNRVSQQTFEHWENFLQACHWTAMKNNADQAYDVVGAMLSQLGLTNAREPTSQKVAAVLALNEVGYARAMQMSEDELQRIYKRVKDTLTAYGKMPADRPSVATFPQTPALYLRAYRAHAEKVYENGPPVTCPFQPDHIACIRGKINMRKRPGSSVLQLSPFDLGVSTQACMQEMQKKFVDFGSHLVKQINDAHSMQHKHENELLELKQTFSQQLALQNQPQQPQQQQQIEQQQAQQPSQTPLALANVDTYATEEPKPIEQATKQKDMAQVTSDLVGMLAGGKGQSKARAKSQPKSKAKPQPTGKAKEKGKAPASGKAAKTKPVAKTKPAAKTSSAKKGGSYKHMCVSLPNRYIKRHHMIIKPGGRPTANRTKHTPC